MHGTLETMVRKHLEKYSTLNPEQTDLAVEFIFNKTPGKALLITGARGTGKTYLANILRGLSGKVVIDAPGITPGEDNIRLNTLFSLGVAAPTLPKAILICNRAEWGEIHLAPTQDQPVIEAQDLRERLSEQAYLGSLIVRL